MYRDETEATRARLSTLEAELASARQLRRDLEAQAAGARQARREAMRAKTRPGRSLRKVAVVLALLLVGTLVFGVHQLVTSLRTLGARRAEAAMESARVAAGRQRVHALRRELERERARCKPAPLPSSTLTRQQIQDAMRTARPKIQACYDRHQVAGTAFAAIEVVPSGAVASAQIRGMFTGTPTAACIEEAVRGIRFPSFRGQRFSFTYPFTLRKASE